MFRPIVHARVMEAQLEHVAERKEKADRWRVLGERLHAASPVMFEQLFALIVLSIPEGDDEKITESYLLT